MPFGTTESSLTALGLACVASATYFYKRKQTLPFKVSYFFAWPTLGTGILLGVMPSTDALVKMHREVAGTMVYVICHGVQKMEEQGSMDRQVEQQAHRASQLQMRALQEAAQAGAKGR